MIGKQEFHPAHIAVAARRAIWASPLRGMGEFRGKKAEARIVLEKEHHATISHHLPTLGSLCQDDALLIKNHAGRERDGRTRGVVIR